MVCILQVLILTVTTVCFRYDPYAKKFTEEFYDHESMRKSREDAIAQSVNASRFGIILGTLGHQGSPKVLDCLTVSI